MGSPSWIISTSLCTCYYGGKENIPFIPAPTRPLEFQVMMMLFLILPCTLVPWVHQFGGYVEGNYIGAWLPALAAATFTVWNYFNGNWGCMILGADVRLDWC